MFSKIKSKDKAENLKKILDKQGIIVMPGCFDALSAKLIEREGFDVGFMSGFSVSSTRLGMPDTGLISFSEMAEQVRNICNSTTIPIIFDGDTGYGNSVNVFRTVRGYADAGAAGVMIEDQKWPKKCGHTKGKDVVDIDEAKSRIKAAVDARKYGDDDILIMARTDAIATHGLDEAIKRMQIFSKIGVDILFIEAVKTKEDMKKIMKEVPGNHMVNLIEDGDTPLLEINELEEIGYKIAVMPLTLMSASVKTMQECLKNMKNKTYNTNVTKFSELRDIVGFNEYYDIEDKYK